ncbi:LutC/YkgG family protein [Andreprevotia chitinilytica]|uniref:LutC/YkgG family protein n=1 Tax=Andreprevotia chitinilytica TaxID=396808 RepID=UPI00055109B5|nr:LUD domain-containing protein [Andreprevotia chitinilytica]
MTNRDAILAAVRQKQPASCALPKVPLFDTDLPPTRAAFIAALGKMGGVWLEGAGLADDFDSVIRNRFPSAKNICSAVPEAEGTCRIESIDDPRQLDGVDIGVVRAGFAVAETGSVWLSEVQYSVNALGYLPQHLVVLLDPADIVPNLHHAYQRREFFTARYAVLMTGPSATADIEGVLIRGAQGIRSLTVLELPRSSND